MDKQAFNQFIIDIHFYKVPAPLSQDALHSNFKLHYTYIVNWAKFVSDWTDFVAFNDDDF